LKNQKHEKPKPLITSRVKFEIIEIVDKIRGYQPIFLFFIAEARNVG